MKNIIQTLKFSVDATIKHLFPIRFSNINDFITAAHSFEYKVSIEEKYYPARFGTDDALQITPQTSGCGSFYLALRGKKEGCYDIICSSPVGYWDAFSNNDIFDQIAAEKKKIIASLNSLKILIQENE